MGRMKDVVRKAQAVPQSTFVASAANVADMTQQEISRVKSDISWQARCYGHYHNIGEYRFACDWKGNMLSKAILHAGLNKQDGKGVQTQTEGPAKFWMDKLGGDEDGRAELLRLIGVNFSIAGECYVVAYQDTDPLGDGGDIWTVVAPTKIRIPTRDSTGKYTGKYAIANVEIDRDPTEVLCIRIWNSDVEDPLKAMAPSQAVLDSLDEIHRLTEHVAAQVDSRLAGAGILLLPSEMTLPTPAIPDGAQVKQANTAVQVMNLINQAMAESIRNRSKASAKVPIVITAPGEVIEKVQHLTFWSDLDEKAIEMRKEAIQRLALGLDMPPEVLMGTAESNHWNAWQADEASIKAHTEPLLKIITSSLAKGYLRRNLRGGLADGSMKVADTELRFYTIIADTSEMRLRPNRSKEALELYHEGILSREAVIRETGFDPSDAMADEERTAWLIFKLAQGQTTPEFVQAALEEMGVKLNVTVPETDQTQEARPQPSLVDHPVQDIPDQARSERRRDARNEGNVPSADIARVASVQSTLSDDRARLAAGTAVACEQAVFRALERAGNRMKQKMGGKAGGLSAGEQYLVFGAQTGDLDFYLDDAWGQNVYHLADHAGIEPNRLKDALDGYTRMLMTTKTPHTFKLLEKHLELALRGVAA
jgi:hypothetical protein